jgi:hypothetical protein
MEQTRLQQLRSQIGSRVRLATRGALRLARQFGAFAELMAIDTGRFVSRFAAQRDPAPALADYLQQMRQLRAVVAAVRGMCLDDELFPLARVDTRGIKAQLAGKAAEICTALIEHLVQKTRCVKAW